MVLIQAAGVNVNVIMPRAWRTTAGQIRQPLARFQCAKAYTDEPPAAGDGWLPDAPDGMHRAEA